MSSQIYELDVKAKSLNILPQKSMTDLGATEPYDLEAWLASTGKQLFNREILWIARQDRPADDQRSDLIGLDAEGNLLVGELKRGRLDASGVTQALAYAAEYAEKTADQLADLYYVVSQKEAATGLVAKATTNDDAANRIASHCGAETELNEAQILLLVAEDFDPKALAICDYLNGASGDANYSLECWRYSIFEQKGQHLFLMEQILPPPSVRQIIEEKREAAKGKRYLRDPVKIEFIKGFLSFLTREGGEIIAERSRGQSYGCRLRSKSWLPDHEVQFYVWDDYKIYLSVPKELPVAGLAEGNNLTASKQSNGITDFSFPDIDASTTKFTEAFGKRVVEIVGKIKEPIASVSTPKAPEAVQAVPLQGGVK